MHSICPIPKLLRNVINPWQTMRKWYTGISKHLIGTAIMEDVICALDLCRMYDAAARRPALRPILWLPRTMGVQDRTRGEPRKRRELMS